MDRSSIAEEENEKKKKKKVFSNFSLKMWRERNIHRRSMIIPSFVTTATIEERPATIKTLAA